MSTKLRIGLIADTITSTSLTKEIDVINLTPLNYKLILKLFHLDLILVESSWRGVRDTWKYKIASYLDYPKRNNLNLVNLVNFAKDKGIPTIFWNKEDGVHFDRFIESAKHFDHIFTVDQNCIHKYECLGIFKSVNTLMFPVQPKFHSSNLLNFKNSRANFSGSYNSLIHPERRECQSWLFKAASESMGLDIYDRNSSRKGKNYRYPHYNNSKVLPALKYPKTANIYSSYYASLNVNTIEDSTTMYSRRLVEILASGGIAVTPPSLAVNTYFKEYCHLVSHYEEAFDLFSRLKVGPTKRDLDKAQAGAEYILNNHTWAHRISDILEVIGL